MCLDNRLVSLLVDQLIHKLIWSVGDLISLIVRYFLGCYFILLLVVWLVYKFVSSSLFQ